MAITTRQFLAAFAHRPDVAKRLAAAIEQAGSARPNQILSRAEIEAALKLAKADGFDSAALRKDFELLFGADFSVRLTSAAAVEDAVRVEGAASGITQQDLLYDLRVLTKTPGMTAREAGSADYMKAAGYVADQLAKAGVKPMLKDAAGQESYFQNFKWEERFAPGTISRSANVVGRLPGTGPEPRETVLVIAHLDNLSKAEKLDYQRRDGRDLSRYEGANDNTASVAALLEVARGLQSAGKTRRDVVFVIPSAEEDGLKGTEAFIKSGAVPLDRVVGAVNMEMIGQNATTELLLYGGKTSADAAKNPLYGRAEKIAAATGTTVKPGPENDDGEGWYERSDHLVTANAGIPSIMFHGRTANGNTTRSRTRSRT